LVVPRRCFLYRILVEAYQWVSQPASSAGAKVAFSGDRRAKAEWTADGRRIARREA
jgi:hypothetical protein